jgi:hypothetical protein
MVLFTYSKSELNYSPLISFICLSELKLSASVVSVALVMRRFIYTETIRILFYLKG